MKTIEIVKYPDGYHVDRVSHSEALRTRETLFVEPTYDAALKRKGEVLGWEER